MSLFHSVVCVSCGVSLLEITKVGEERWIPPLR
jgi:hypothetical protein